MDYLEPARTVIEKLGGNIRDGIDEAAKAAKVHRTRVFRWMRPKESGGTGGLIPVKHHQPLLDWAAANGRPLKKTDFFVKGAPVSHVRPRQRGEPRTTAA